MLMVPAGESASTSALVVWDISIESMPANDNPSKLTARELPAPPLAFAPGRLSPSRVTPVMDDGRPRNCTLVTESPAPRPEEHTSELQSLMSTSYAVFCLKKKTSIRYIIQSVRTKPATSCQHPCHP